MGLAGRKVKQRIGADPRNLTWADDASKFGMKYLQSLGWSSGTGLGVTGEGRVSHLTVHQKLDLMGIGANRKSTDEAGWKGGREYEGLLARLNQAQTQDSHPASEDETQRDLSVVPEESAGNAEATLQDESELSKKESKKRRKRTKDDVDGDDVEGKETKRRRKEEKRARKEEKRARKEEKKARKEKDKRGTKEERTVRESKSTQNQASGQETGVVDVEPTDVKVARHAGPVFRAHRARHLASKRLAAVSSKDMNEILGISAKEDSSVSVSSFPGTPSGKQSPPTGYNEAKASDTGIPCIQNLGVENNAENDERPTTLGLGSAGRTFGSGLGFGRANKEGPGKPEENEFFRKSTISVSDYFADKMRQKQTVGTVKPIEVTEETTAGEAKVRKKSKKEKSEK